MHRQFARYPNIAPTENTKSSKAKRPTENDMTDRLRLWGRDRMKDDTAIGIAQFNASLVVKLSQYVSPDTFVFDNARDAVKVRLAVRVNLSQSALSFSA